ncbi:MAG: cytochrome b/b6 domain-containing protein [Macromonas sp.]
MTSTTTSTTLPHSTQHRDSGVGRGRRVTDAPTRMFHWLFALCFVGAYLTAETEHLRALHVTLGYTLAGLLVFRLLYGVLGPRQASLSVLRNKASTGWLWLRQCPAQLARGHLNWQPGQNLVLVVSIVAMMLLTLPLTLSGWATFNDLGGEWLEEIHKWAGDTMVLVVLLHLGALLLFSLLRRKNLALPMWRGRTPGQGPDVVRNNRLWLALLIAACTLLYWSWEWQQAPNGLISGPALSQAWSGDDGDD